MSADCHVCGGPPQRLAVEDFDPTMLARVIDGLRTANDYQYDEPP